MVEWPSVVSALVSVASFAVAVSAKLQSTKAKLQAAAAEDRAEKVTNDFSAFVKLHAKQYEQTEADRQAALAAPGIADEIEHDINANRVKMWEERSFKDISTTRELPTLAHRLAFEIVRNQRPAGEHISDIRLSPDGASVSFRIRAPDPKAWLG